MNCVNKIRSSRPQVAELSEAQETATRLEGLLELKSTYNLQSTAARIVGSSTDAWSRTVTIDKGSLGWPGDSTCRFTDSSGVIGSDHRGGSHLRGGAPHYRRGVRCFCHGSRARVLRAFCRDSLMERCAWSMSLLMQT